VTESNQLPNKVAATKSGGNNVMGLEFNSNKVFFDYSGLIPFFIFALIFILVPTISVVFFAFKGNFGEWTLENLRVALREEYLSSLIGSLRLGFFSAITGAFFGFFTAYAVSISGRKKLQRVVSTASGVFANTGGVPLAFFFHCCSR